MEVRVSDKGIEGILSALLIADNLLLRGEKEENLRVMTGLLGSAEKEGA